MNFEHRNAYGAMLQRSEEMIRIVDSQTGKTLHKRDCPICRACFMSDSSPVADNLLSQHIAASHVDHWKRLEVPWTLDDLKILEGMKISPK